MCPHKKLPRDKVASRCRYRLRHPQRHKAGALTGTLAHRCPQGVAQRVPKCQLSSCWNALCVLVCALPSDKLATAQLTLEQRRLFLYLEQGPKTSLSDRPQLRVALRCKPQHRSSSVSHQMVCVYQSLQEPSHSHLISQNPILRQFPKNQST